MKLSMSRHLATLLCVLMALQPAALSWARNPARAFNPANPFEGIQPVRDPDGAWWLKNVPLPDGTTRDFRYPVEVSVSSDGRTVVFREKSGQEFPHLHVFEIPRKPGRESGAQSEKKRPPGPALSLGPTPRAACMGGLCQDFSELGQLPGHDKPYVPAPGAYVSSPHLMSDNAFVNQAMAEHRHVPPTPELLNFRRQLLNRIAEAHAQIQPDEQIREKANQAMKDFLSPFLADARLPGDIAPPANPYPQGVSPAALDRDLSPLRDAGQAGDPIDAAEAVADLQRQVQDIRRTNGGEDTARSEYLNEEIHRRILDRRGILQGLLFARPVTSPLRTERDSANGQRIRNNLNLVLASEEIVGFACSGKSANDPGASVACKSYQDQAQQLKDLHLVADRMAAQGKKESFDQMMNTLETAGRFLKGASRSLAEAAAVVGVGMAVTALLPQAVMVGLVTAGVATALWNHGETKAAIQQAAEASWKTIVSGSAKQRGELFGRMSGEVASLFMGGTTVRSIQSAVRPAVERLATKTAGRIGAAAMAATGQLSRSAAQGVERLAGVAPDAAVKLLRQLGPHVERAGKLITRDVAEGFARLDRRGGDALVDDLIQKDPLAAQELGRILSIAKDDSVADHLSKASHVVIRGRHPYGPKDYVKIARTYIDLDEKIANAPRSRWDGEVHRGIRKSLDGVDRTFGPDDVFNRHPGITRTSNRIDMPGNVSLSTVVGPEARETILAETKASSDRLIFGSRKESFDHVLDLTDETLVRGHLNLNPLHLVQSVEDAPNSYLLPNTIGDLAIKHHYEAILLRSAANPGGTNLFILELK